jgi:hypothetical protein
MSALAQACEACRLPRVDGAWRGAAPDDLGDLTRGLERLMGDRRRHEAADVRRRDDTAQSRQAGRRHLVRRAANVHGAAGDTALDQDSLERRFVDQVAA